jgi:hypothetical protein
VSLTELEGLSADLVTVLAQNGKKTLKDILDLEREDVDKLEGMTPELAEKLMAFLNELTEESGEEPSVESTPDGSAPDAPTPEAPAPDAPVPDAPAPDAPVPDAPAPDAPKPDGPAPA